MEILIHEPGELPERLRCQVAALREEAGWGPSGPGLGHDPALHPVSLALVDGERVLGSLVILSKPIEHCGRSYAASGPAGVVVASAERQRGHGRRLIVAARRHMAAAGADLAVFTCDTPLAPFYESGGYAVLPGTVLVGGVPKDPLRSDRFDKVALWRPFTRHARLHAADFRHAAVALYPGTIDRLW